jgi:hypothetical protein
MYFPIHVNIQQHNVTRSLLSYTILLPGKYRQSFDGIKGVSFDGLTSRGIDRDRINFSAAGVKQYIEESHLFSDIMTSCRTCPKIFRACLFVYFLIAPFP